MRVAAGARRFGANAKLADPMKRNFPAGFQRVRDGARQRIQDALCCYLADVRIMRCG